MKFWSFNVVAGLVWPLTFLSTRLPLRSKIFFNKLGSFICKVFSMSMMCTSFIYGVFTVKTPRIFARILFLFVVKWWANAGILSSNNLSSVGVMVLMMNLASCEKKKKLPDLPAPSPALKIMSLLCFGLRLWWMFTSCAIKKSANISLNRSILWKVTLTVYFMTKTFFSNEMLTLVRS